MWYIDLHLYFHPDYYYIWIGLKSLKSLSCSGYRETQQDGMAEGERWDLRNHTSQQCFPRQVLWVLEKEGTCFLYFKESNVYKTHYF